MRERLSRKRIFLNFLHNMPTERNFKPGELPLVFDLSERDVTELGRLGYPLTMFGNPLRGMTRYYFCGWRFRNSNIWKGFGLATQPELEMAIDYDLICTRGVALYGQRMSLLQYKRAGAYFDFGIVDLYEVKGVKIYRNFGKEKSFFGVYAQFAH